MFIEVTGLSSGGHLCVNVNKITTFFTNKGKDGTTVLIGGDDSIEIKEHYAWLKQEINKLLILRHK